MESQTGEVKMKWEWRNEVVSTSLDHVASKRNENCNSYAHFFLTLYMCVCVCMRVGVNQFFCPLSCFPTIQYKAYWLVKLNSLFHLFIFNCRIIALQYCVGFCYTSAWISHMHAYVRLLLNLLPTPSHPSRLLRSTKFGIPISDS